MKISRIIIVFIFLSFTLNLLAQDNNNTRKDVPEVGKPCPDFTLHNIGHFSKQEVRLSDFRGKWLVLDFWNRSCGTCIASLPKMDRLAKQFKEGVQFIMIGFRDRKNDIQALYEAYWGKLHLELPCAIDSSLALRWNYLINPTILVIDPDGIIRAITYSLDAVAITDFLAGKDPTLANPAANVEKYHFDDSLPLLVDNNGGEESSAIYRSVLAKATARTPHIVNFLSLFTYKEYQGKFWELDLPLSSLYMLANWGVHSGESFSSLDSGFYGNYVPSPVIQTKDSCLFKYDFPRQEGLYCYYANFPPSSGTTKEGIMKVLRLDLKKWFGYDAITETRNMPCWKLVATDKARKILPTNGGQTGWGSSSIFHLKVDLINSPIKELIELIAYDCPNEPAIIDETGIKGNIDINIQAVFSDINDVKRALREHGLDLVKGEKEMKVLVIRDPKPAKSITN